MQLKPVYFAKYEYKAHRDNCRAFTDALDGRCMKRSLSIDCQKLRHSLYLCALPDGRATAAHVAQLLR